MRNWFIRIQIERRIIRKISKIKPLVEDRCDDVIYSVRLRYV